jgi:hypothetical protein
MSKIIDAEVYQRSHPLRIAFLDGKLSMCDEIKELANIILARANISPFKPTTDFEEGQIAALTAIIEACATFEAGAEKQDTHDTSFDA